MRVGKKRTAKLATAVAVATASLCTTIAQAETTYTAPIMLPSNVQMRQVVIGASYDVYIGGATAVKPAAAQAPSLIANTGTKGTYIDALSTTVGITSVPPVSLITSTINGSVTSQGSVNNALSTVNGKLTAQTPISIRQAGALKATYPDENRGDVLGIPLLTTTLTPGRYNNALAVLNSTLRFTAGKYYFNKLETALGGTLDIDSTNGPVEIYVTESLTHLGEQRGRASQFLLGYFGTADVALKGSFSGSVIAPNATIWMGHLPFGILQGTFYARSVQVFGGANVVHVPTTAVSTAPIPARLPVGVATDIPGYPQGDVNCGPALQLNGQTVNAQGEPAWTSVSYVSSGAPGCHVAPKFCDANNQPVATPSEAALNANPGAGSKCAPMGGAAGIECAVDPTTLGATCRSDSDCPSGNTCGNACLNASCTSTGLRCGKPYASCAGLTAEPGNCDDSVNLYECPDPRDVGTVSQAAVDQQLPEDLVEPASITLPVAERVTVPAIVPPNTDYCSNTDLTGPEKKTEQGKAKGVDVGNDKWGAYLTPVSRTFSNFKPMKFLGEGTFEVGGSYGLDAGVRILGKKVSVVGADASASIAHCGVAIGATFKVFGDAVWVWDAASIPAGVNLLAGKTPEQQKNECLSKFVAQNDAAHMLRKALFGAENAVEFYKKNGMTVPMCERAKSELNLASISCAADAQGRVNDTTARGIVQSIIGDYDLKAQNVKSKSVRG